MTRYSRNVERELCDVLAASRAAALLGPRQSGKTTLARLLVEKQILRSYYSLDDDDLRSIARSDPSGFVDSVERPAVIDEVQRAPELMLAIKQVLDTDAKSAGQFLLTGSANLLTSRHVADALPGRVEYVNLWPLSQGELSSAVDSLPDMLLRGDIPRITGAERGRTVHAERVVAGGYPEALQRTTAKRRGTYFDSYLQGVLSRDLPELSGVHADPARFERLFHLLAARAGGEINYRKLSQQLGVVETTVKAHIGLLEQMFQVVRLRPWSANLGTRQVRSSKVYLTDTGLASALVGVDADRYAALDQGEIAGMLLENFVVMEIVKQRTWSESRMNLYFYRDNKGREVDIVIESASGDVAAIEVKAAATVNASGVRGLQFLRDKLGARFKAGVVLYSGEHSLQLDQRVWAVPLRGLWSP